MTLSFIGSWGERPETEIESARRMQRSWEAFPQNDGVYTPWSLQLYPEGVLELQPVSAGDLEDVVDAVRRVTERINEGPRTAPGAYLEFARERLDVPVSAGGPLFTYEARCGFAGPRAPRNHVLLGLIDTAEEALVRDYFVALVRAWEPEHVSVCTYAFHKAQRHETPQVRVGWLTYIRDDVSLDVTAVPESVRVEAGDGGRYLTLSGTPEQPDLDEALSVRRVLGYPT